MVEDAETTLAVYMRAAVLIVGQVGMRECLRREVLEGAQVAAVDPDGRDPREALEQPLGDGLQLLKGDLA